MRTRLGMGLSGPDVMALARATSALGIFGKGMPTELWVDDRQKKTANLDWIDRWVPGAKRNVIASWDNGVHSSICVTRDVGLVTPSIDELVVEPKAVLELIAPLPFELASFDDTWPLATAKEYWAPGFSNMHWPHGWACAFRGDGHKRLVSRRWLDFGPWLVRRGPSDTTLVQFYDLDADVATALAQAKPGHERMGISDTGGFLQLPNYPFTNDLNGVYLADKRQLSIVVHGRDVSQRELRDACAARYLQVLGPDKPIDSVAYVFMEESVARAHLHEMWLRDLEVRAFIRGVETRLDTDYRPAVEKPEWVRRVEAREGC